jgi:hypothetical protein
LSQQEQPWQPGPNDLPFTTHLINPHGDRHLGFDEDEGRYYRLWQHKAPERLHTGEAIFLRPSDINQIISYAMIWVRNRRPATTPQTRVPETASAA